MAKMELECHLLVPPNKEYKDRVTAEDGEEGLNKEQKPEGQKHPLRLYMTSPDIKTMKSSKIAEAIREWTSVSSFVIDKMFKRTYAFLHFNNPNDALQFLKDVNGKIINKIPLKIAQCESKPNQNSKTPGWSRQQKSLQQQEPLYHPQIGPFPPWDISHLPYIADLKQKRYRRVDRVTVNERVTPLIGYSYPAQLEMKYQFLKTSVKNFTRKIFEVIYKDPKISRRQAKRRKVDKTILLKDGINDNDVIESSHRKLLWCHPEVAKGFNGCQVDPIIPSSNARLRYRNKCEFTIGFDNDDMKVAEVGFVTKVVNNEPIVAHPYGLLHIPYSMQEVCFHLKGLILGNIDRFPVYSRSTQKGVWRIVMVRHSTYENSLMVVIQIKALSSVAETLGAQDLRSETELRMCLYNLLVDNLVYTDGDTRSKLRTYDGMIIKSLFVQERAESSDAFDGNNSFDLIYGSEYLTQQLLGLQFRVHPAAFFQTNTETCAALYQRAFKMLKITSQSIVLDICSGTGTIALTLYNELEKNREGVQRFIGIELVPEAVESAKENARLNGIPEGENGVEFLTGKAEIVLPNLLNAIKNDHEKDVEICAIVDPPRAGLHPTVCASLLSCQQINRLVYVSCNPETLAVDVVRLCTPTSITRHPFKPILAVGVDMFPHTFHCEMILELQRTTELDFGTVQDRDQR